MISLFFATAFVAMAQDPAMRFRVETLRFTVPVGSTSSSSLTNFINLNAGASNAIFSVTGLPPGTSFSLTDTNGSLLPSTDADTNLVLTVLSTNIPEGIHVFNFNASGTDTNGVPLTNTIPFVLQSAHIWNGTINSSNNWADAASWLNGVPTSTSDVVFGDTGAQTNANNTLAITNIGIDANTIVGSVRFSQSVLRILDVTTNSLYHTVKIAPGRTLTISGTNGFSLMRDYINDLTDGQIDRTFGVTFIGSNATVVVSNAAANFSVLVGGTAIPTLSMSNLSTLAVNVSRVGLADYQLYPNYREVNLGINAGRNTNTYQAFPRRFVANISLAQTNYITAIYKDPNNYTDESNRGYAFNFENSEQSGVGSSQVTFLFLGRTNRFLMDSVCLGGANHAPTVRFGFTNGAAVFRSTNGGRMSVFTISDDGGSTNTASSNVKAVIDLAANNGLVDILADRFYISRDRVLIASNQTPNVQGDFLMGRGTVDVNTAILGYQEHTKPDWNLVYGTSGPYLNYCRGILSITNGGIFRVNGVLTLGFTADSNAVAHAQQYNTFGRITVFSGSTVSASNIVADGGLNFFDANNRQNDINILQGGTVIVTNTMGAPAGLSAGDPRGLPIDNLNMTAGTLTLFVTAGKTNVFVRNFVCSGSTPSIVKVATLTGVTSFPTNIPIISYDLASPFLAADMSAIGGGVQGYIINDAPGKIVNLFLTTNAPNTLVWRGQVNNNWDLTTKNWATVAGNLQTNFSLGDIVTFDDSTTVTNINIVDVVVPNQATNGVTLANNTRGYTFNAAGGAIAGTAKILKTGVGGVTFNASESGPFTILSGTLDGSGVLGTVTVASNCLLNFSGTVGGGLTSTGTVVMASSSSINGAVTLRGGSFYTAGQVATAPGAMQITGTVAITNDVTGVMTIAGGNWDVPFGSTLANFGQIFNVTGRLNFSGLFFGTGSVTDLNSPSGNGRVSANVPAIWAPGPTPSGSIGSMFVGARVDLNNVPATGFGTLVIDVDFSNPQTNDTIYADKWSNINGMIVMTNDNPGAGVFALGQSFQVFVNNNGVTISNQPDAEGTIPTMSPYIPASGLQWGLLTFRPFGNITITNTGLIWNGNLSGSWDSSTVNWKAGQTYNDNQGVQFDDTAVGNTVITLTNAMAPAGWTISSNIVVGVSTNGFSTNSPVMSPGMVVSNGILNYTFTGVGKISGMTGLYKTGPGTLTILTTNDYTGNTIIVGGTVSVTNVAGVGANNNANNSRGNNNQLILDGGTLKYIGAFNSSMTRANYIGPNDGTIEVEAGTNELTASSISGPGGLTKTGPSTLVLNGTSPYLGGTTLSAGDLRVPGTGRIGTGGLTIGPSTTLQITNSFNLTNAISVPSGSAILRVLGTSTNVSSGPWTGGGTLTFSNSVNPFTFDGNLSGFSGTFNFGSLGGAYRFNNATNGNDCTGSALATFNLGTGSASLSNFNGAGLTYHLGALAGGPNTILAGRSTNTASWTAASTYSIGANGSNTAFFGRIMNGVDTVSVIKVGGGTLALNGNNTYSGLTTVSSGTLGGTGVISGPVTVSAGGTLAPGMSIGTLTINNSLTLSGTTAVEVSNNGGTLTSDRVVGLTSVSYGGTLVVSNLGPSALVSGNSFQLFNMGGSGDFSSITPALTSPLAWDFDPATGVLSVIGGGSQPTLNFTNNGNGSMTFTWSASGFKLQSQTNSLTIGFSTNWITYPGGGTSPVNVVFIPTNPAVFFRLVTNSVP